MRRLLLLAAAFVAFLDASPASAQTLQWARSLAGSGGNIYHLETSSAGSVYITGNFLSSTDMDPGAGTATLTTAGNSDCFVARYDAAGNYLWARRIGGTDWDYTFGLAVDSAGNAYVGGYFRGTLSFAGTSTTLTSGSGVNNPFIAKYDASGNLLWARALTGTGTGYLRGLRVDGSGNVIVTGTFSGTLNFNPAGTAVSLTASGFDLFIAKYSASGVASWAKRVDSSNSVYYPNVAVDSGGNILVATSFAGTLNADPNGGSLPVVGAASSSGPTSLFIGKYSSAGSVLWARGVVGAGTDPNSVGSAVAVDGGGNVIVTGYFTGSANFGAQSLTSFGDWDVFIAKYSSTNAAQWAVQLGGAGAETGSGIGADTSGAIYTVGSYFDSGDYHPSPGSTVTLSHLGTAGFTSDTFLVKLDSSGAYQWAHALNSASDDHTKDLTIDGSNNLYINGFTAGTVDFDVSAATATVSGSTAAKYALGVISSGLVPPMTSNTAPSGIVTASGVYGAGYEAWKVFDATTSIWLSNSNTSAVWVGYEWGGGVLKTVSSYEVRYANGSCCEQRGPKNWTLQGWNGAAWVTVDTVTNQTGWYLNHTRTFTVDSPGAYARYRLYITADNYNNVTYPITLVSISKLQFY